MLYRNSLLAEYDLPAALDHLRQIEDTVCAPGVIYEFEAEYLSKLQDFSKQEEVVKAWERLVERNPESKDYLYGLERAMNISPDNRKSFWEDLSGKYPRATSIKLIPLEFLEGIKTVKYS